MEDIFAPRKRRVRYGLRPELGLYHEEIAPSEEADLVEFLSLLPSASDPRPIRKKVMIKAWRYLSPSVREQLKSALRRAWAEVRR